MDLFAIADGIRRALGANGIAAQVQVDPEEPVEVRYGNGAGLLAVGTPSSVRMAAVRVTLRPACGDSAEAARWLREERGAAVAEAELFRLLPAHIGHRLTYDVWIDDQWKPLEPPRLGLCRLGRTRPCESNPEVPRMLNRDAPLPADVQLTIKKIQEIFDLDPNRLPEQFGEFIRWEMQRRSRAFRDDAVLTAAQMNDLSDRLAAVERWMARYTPYLDRIARTVRPAPSDIPLNTRTPEDDT
jgi:hypothetical protein